MDFIDLYPRFENCLINIIVLSDRIIPSNVLRDLEFFITEPYVNSNCRTNTDLAYELGKLNTDDNLSKALHTLFLARDSMIKGFVVEYVADLLTKCEILLSSVSK